MPPSASNATSASSRLEVHPIDARTPAELDEHAPRLLGVRHLAHAQEWSTPAINLYLHSQYGQLWANAHGDAPWQLEETLLDRLAGTAATSPSRARRSVQTVTCFHHFRERFGARLPAGESLSDDDQTYFARLLEPGHARQRFGILDSDLALRAEMEELLFRWAFSRPRGDGRTRDSVLRSPACGTAWRAMTASTAPPSPRRSTLSTRTRPARWPTSSCSTSRTAASSRRSTGCERWRIACGPSNPPRSARNAISSRRCSPKSPAWCETARDC
jgi:hypothetical protein